MVTQTNSILILEPVQLQADLWKNAFAELDDFQSVTLVDSIEQALAAASRHNVALIGTSFELGVALRNTRDLATRNPHMKVLVSGIPRQEPQVVRAVEAGAAGLILQDETVSEAIESVRAAIQGGARIPPDLAPALMEHLAELKSSFVDPETEGKRYELLTPREREVLSLIARGMTNKQIANHLTIEVGTVKNHVHNLLGKLGVSSRHQAADYLRSLRPQQFEPHPNGLNGNYR